MIVIQAPHPTWLDRLFRCQECEALVRFTLDDLHDRSSFNLRQRETDGTWTGRARCAVCRNPLARFEEEEPIPMVDTTDDSLTLAPCVLCGRGYPTSEMWPRPDGFICHECSMKVPNDDQ